MAKYVVIYQDMREDAVTPDMAESLVKSHVEYLKDLYSRKILFMCGILKDNDDKGLLIFDVNSKEEAESYVLKDPFIVRKCYSSYSISEWVVANESNNWLLNR